MKDITTSSDALGATSKKSEVKEQFTLEQGTKNHRGIRGIALLFL